MEPLPVAGGSDSINFLPYLLRQNTFIHNDHHTAIRLRADETAEPLTETQDGFRRLDSLKGSSKVSERAA